MYFDHMCSTPSNFDYCSYPTPSKLHALFNLFFINSLPSPISAPHMHKGVKPSAEVQANYQLPCPRRKVIPPRSAALTCQWLLC